MDKIKNEIIQDFVKESNFKNYKIALNTDINCILKFIDGELEILNVFEDILVFFNNRKQTYRKQRVISGEKLWCLV